MIHVVLLVVCAVVIYLACEWFVNAVEWLGVRMKVGAIAVGTVLAAAGTALPESVVTLVAVLFGSPEHGDDVAVGAALGGPLVVGTIAYGVTGAMLLHRRHRAGRLAAADRVLAGTPADGPGARSSGSTDESGDRAAFAGVDLQRLGRDQTWFLAIFSVKVALGLVAFAIKPWLGLVFFAAYAAYFVREMTGDEEHASADGLTPLKLQRRRAVPATWAVLTQTVVTLAVIFVASQVFVTQIEWAGPAMALPTTVVALLLAPVATELPEILNAIIWVRQGKVGLALANVSGSMRSRPQSRPASGYSRPPGCSRTRCCWPGC